MPLVRIYRCKDCDETRMMGFEMHVPICPGCRGPMKWSQTRDYVSAAHVEQFGQAPALDYNQTKGRIAPIGNGVEINSLHDIRRIEREAEKRYRDGVGEPLVFRKYSQDNGNLHTNTLGDAPQQGPSAEWMKKNGHKIGSIREGDIPGMGPSMTEDNASYLPTDPI